MHVDRRRTNGHELKHMEKELTSGLNLVMPLYSVAFTHRLSTLVIGQVVISDMTLAQIVCIGASFWASGCWLILYRCLVGRGQHESSDHCSQHHGILLNTDIKLFFILVGKPIPANESV